MKKRLSAAVLSMAMLAAANQAQAVNPDVFINIYGASAQKAFWGELGVPYLTATGPNGGAGCKTAVKASYAADSNFGIIKGTQCSTNAGGTIYLTYGSVASLEGVKAAKEVAPIDDKNSCAASYGNAFRQVVDEATCNWSGDLKCSSVKCADITLGASDVAGASFNQESHGGKNGYFDTTPFDVVLTPEATTGLANYRPTVVPFAFFMNNDASDTPAMDNLTRTQAANIFAGNLRDWSQFGPDYPQKGVVVCLRHAGSGTHATLDKGVMRGDLKLVTQEQIIGAAGTLPDIMFFQSSSGEAQCVAENGGYGAGGDFIAVGYADADVTTTSGNGMHVVKYEGADATADNIANGVYGFWSSQWIYVKPADKTAPVKRVMAYASKHVPASKAGVWLPAQDLNVIKPADSKMPVLK